MRRETRRRTPASSRAPSARGESRSAGRRAGAARPTRRRSRRPASARPQARGSEERHDREGRAHHDDRPRHDGHDRCEQVDVEAHRPALVVQEVGRQEHALPVAEVVRDELRGDVGLDGLVAEEEDREAREVVQARRGVDGEREDEEDHRAARRPARCRRAVGVVSAAAGERARRPSRSRRRHCRTEARVQEKIRFVPRSETFSRPNGVEGDARRLLEVAAGLEGLAQSAGRVVDGDAAAPGVRRR